MKTIIKSRNLAIQTHYMLSADKKTCAQFRDDEAVNYAMQWIIKHINKRGMTLFTFNLTGQLTEIFLNRRDWDGIPPAND